MVELTYGQFGRSVMIDRGTDTPLLIDDGRRVAENIHLDDPIEQMAVKVAYNVTKKTDEKAGDGTTTSAILTRAIMNTVSKERIGSGIGLSYNVSEIDNEIHATKTQVLALLDKEAKPIKTEKEIIDVATVITGSPDLGKIIGSMYWKLGKDGHISMEIDHLSEKITTEYVSGYRLQGGYAAPWMNNNPITKKFNASDVSILVTDQDVRDIDNITTACNVVVSKSKNILIVIAPSFDQSILKLAYDNATRANSPFFLICVKMRNQETYKDIAVFTGAKCFTENDNIKESTLEHLGHVRAIEISEDTTILTDGHGAKKDIATYTQEVIAEAQKLKLAGLREEKHARVSAMTGNVGIIRIGAPTAEEREWLRYKIEDAKNATKHAMREGVVTGGGLTFKKISESLPDNNILKSALLAPYETLKANAGGKLVVGKNIFDAVVVEKAAIEYACSAASKLLRIGGAIAYKDTPTLDEAMKQFVKSE